MQEPVLSESVPRLPIVGEIHLQLGFGLLSGLSVEPVGKRVASQVAVARHYLHRAPPVSYSFGLFHGHELAGVVTFGTPASRQLQVGVCRSDPAAVIELNRLWVDDSMPRNTESWFVSRALHLLPPRIVISYADTSRGHMGYVYRALNFQYAGWTDMERASPRVDYIPASGGHTRDAFRGGANYVAKVPRAPKVKYWLPVGDRRERKRLRALCGWPSLDWREHPPPTEHRQLRLAS